MYVNGECCNIFYCSSLALCSSFSPLHADMSPRWISPLMSIQSQTEYSSSRPWPSLWWCLCLTLHIVQITISYWKRAVAGQSVLTSVSRGCRQRKLTSSWTPSVSTRPMATQWKKCWRSHQCCTARWKQSRWPWEIEVRRTTASLSLTSDHGWDFQRIMYVMLKTQQMPYIVQSSRFPLFY